MNRDEESCCVICNFEGIKIYLRADLYYGLLIQPCLRPTFDKLILYCARCMSYRLSFDKVVKKWYFVPQ